MSVWPSGGDLATSAVPIVLAPPALFSTYTLCPSCVVSSCATERAMISEVPPGANGTTKRIGFVGKPWAEAPREMASAAAPASSLFMRVSWSELVAAQAPVDGNDRAGDVARARRHEEGDERRQLLRLAVAAHVDLVLRLPLPVLGRVVA